MAILIIIDLHFCLAIKDEFDLKSGEGKKLMALQVHHKGVEKAKYFVPCNYFGHTYSVTYLPFVAL